MRVALVSVSDQLGGSEMVLLETVRQLRRLRPSWEVHVVTPGRGPMSARAADLGATIHEVAMPEPIARFGEWGSGGAPALIARGTAAAAALPAYESRFRAALRAIRPDVLHSNGFKAHVLCARAATGARSVWHLHEYVAARALTSRLLRMYAPRCDHWIANSESVAADVRTALGPPFSSRGVVIPNGVDLDTFRPDGPTLDLDALSGLTAAPGPVLRVGLVGTFSRWKGHEVFIQAIARLPLELAVRGYVVGGPLYDTAGSQWTLEELRAFTRSAGCESRLGFTGFQPDAPAALRSLDVVVHASTSPEPFGLVLIEAMACGRPLVTTGLGGSGEIVRDGVNAAIYVAHDPSSLASVIERLARSREERDGLAGRARATVEDRYSVGSFGQAIVVEYERCAGAAA